MVDDPRKFIVDALEGLDPQQVECVAMVVRSLQAPLKVTIGKSDFVTERFGKSFGDILRVHHTFSAEAFTKDKYEHAMVRVLIDVGRKASLAPRGNPGHDISVDGEPWSLKTQADKGIKRDFIYISKFKELGKGAWRDEKDLAGLRDSMLTHMKAYERIFILRCLSKNRSNQEKNAYEYELVEIPKALLEMSRGGKIEMQHSSKQNPKPGYCTVTNQTGQVLYKLYFDAGTERKLQIKDIAKSECIVHANWQFVIT